jgi:hypothetical protein
VPAPAEAAAKASPAAAAAAAAAATIAENVISADRTALSAPAAIPLQAAAASAVPLQQPEQQRATAVAHTESAVPARSAALHIPPRDHSISSRLQTRQSNVQQQQTTQPVLEISATEAARDRGRQLQEAISVLLHDTD